MPTVRPRGIRSGLRTALTCIAAALLAACATPAAVSLTEVEQARLTALLPAELILLGEQHDAPEHQRLERQFVSWLAERGVLEALAIEMAEQGRDTRVLPRDASEADVRAALAWDGLGWPWTVYGPLVMAAVRAGVPVLGANLARVRMREAMRDDALDARVAPAVLAEQQQRIRQGHCDHLPETQILPMTRIQIARDLAMADTVARAVRRGRTVLLVAGNGHVQRDVGVPLHLPPDLRFKVVSALAAPPQGVAERMAGNPAAGADLVWPTSARRPRDYCAEFKHPPQPSRAPAQ